MTPLASWLIVVILILVALLAVALWNWRQAERDLAESDRELAETQADLDVALGWEERRPATHARSMLQLIHGGDQ